MKDVTIYGDYIQLDQFLKKMDYISSGGETGAFLESHTITLNGSRVHEKRKKNRKRVAERLAAEEAAKVAAEAPAEEAAAAPAEEAVSAE